jgi:hypothetical protein
MAGISVLAYRRLLLGMGSFHRRRRNGLLGAVTGGGPLRLPLLLVEACLRLWGNRQRHHPLSTGVAVAGEQVVMEVGLRDLGSWPVKARCRALGSCPGSPWPHLLQHQPRLHPSAPAYRCSKRRDQRHQQRRVDSNSGASTTTRPRPHTPTNGSSRLRNEAQRSLNTRSPVRVQRSSSRLM